MPISISLTEILYALATIIFTFKAVKRKNALFSCFPHKKLLAFYIVFPLFSLIYANNFYKFAIWYKRHLYILLFPIIIFLLTEFKEKKEVFLKIFTFSTAISSVLAILQAFFGANLDKPFNIHTYYVFSKGFFSHPLTYAETTSFGIIAGIFLFFSGKNRKWPYFFLTVINFIGLIFSREKMPLFATILLSGLFCFYYSFKISGRKKEVFLFLVFVFLLILLPNKEKIFWRLSSNKLKYSVNVRKENWQKSIEYFKKSPVFGIGFGNFKIEVEKWNKKGKETLYHAHNNIFEILATTGIIGLLAFILFHGAIFYDLIFYLKKNKKDGFILTIFFIFLLYHMEGITECTFKDAELNFQLYFLLALFYSAYCPFVKDKNKTGKKEKPSQLNH